ncbi:MAG: hydroxymethylglutaryl-CoA lyase [Thermaurantimonas sp.]|uniref:hydroxymethylglutaryl-CoA lyase n=1 Tax=Thermaurantimonas sp. TaxID=2681568 RepID=UPI00391C5E98
MYDSQRDAAIRQVSDKEEFIIVECPRDAMQGLKEFIDTDRKITYLNALLKVNFHTLDFGSFVSPKAIPQMRDTAEVLEGLDLTNTKTKLLAIVANERGGEQACKYTQISYLGYPFSVSEEFQKRNTNKSIDESLELVEDLYKMAKSAGKELVVYLSMGFGNPYGDEWSPEIVLKWSKVLADIGIRTLSVSDTVGIATVESIHQIFNLLIPALPHVTFGAHLHTLPYQWFEKIDAAYKAGCRRFDGAIRGFGGCPMAKDELTGNMPTEKLISYMLSEQLPNSLNLLAFESAYNEALKIFN